jgi:hypothetical protein
MIMASGSDRVSPASGKVTRPRLGALSGPTVTGPSPTHADKAHCQSAEHFAGSGPICSDPAKPRHLQRDHFGHGSRWNRPVRTLYWR